MSNLPTNIADAPLPVNYKAACIAVSECQKVDECKSWADKAEALRSYARQIRDETLEKTAKRIRGRALRRAGELLEEFDGRPNNAAKKQSGGAPTLISKRDAAAEAGLSKDQQNDATRIARIPQDEFDTMLESDDPPSTTEMAMHRMMTRDVPEGYQDATHFAGAIRALLKQVENVDPAIVAAAFGEHERQDIIHSSGRAVEWLVDFLEKANELC